MRWRPALLLLLALAGCGTGANAPPTDWRSVASADDRKRLREWRSSFAQALARARASGHGAAIAREGALLDPDSAVPGRLPDGHYRCRVIKVGAQRPAMPELIASPAFTCRVQRDGAIQRFAKLGGSQRPVGVIYPADAIRQVFLGTLLLGDETRSLSYGRDSARDLAGWVERIGPARWRIVLPAPRLESITDIVELVPLAPNG